MTAKEFLDMVNRGNDLQDEDLVQALQLAASYPYFTIPHILSARFAVRQKNETTSEYISNAAIRVPNRNRLKELVYGEWHFISTPEAEPEIPILDEKENTALLIENHIEDSAEPEKVPMTETNSSVEVTEPTVSTEGPTIPATKRQEVLKQLEENLYKLQENGHVPTDNTPEPEGKDESSNHPADELPADDLIEAIKKKDKKEIPSEKRKEQIALISRFTKKNIRLSSLSNPNDPETDLVDLSISSTQINDSMVSESFAKILVKQKKLREAIEIYEKLQLKYPDKKTYFADCIRELDKK